MKNKLLIIITNCLSATIKYLRINGSLYSSINNLETVHKFRADIAGKRVILGTGWLYKVNESVIRLIGALL